jgi:hypothetical protein
VFVVLAQETNAKSCASLVLRVERESTEWSLPLQKNGRKHEHTPGCLLDGSMHSAEIVRSFLRHKKPLFIDRPKNIESDDAAHFQLSSGKHTKEENLPEPELLPSAEVFERR